MNWIVSYFKLLTQINTEKKFFKPNWGKKKTLLGHCVKGLILYLKTREWKERIGYSC